MTKTIRIMLAAAGAAFLLALPAVAAAAGEDTNHHPGPSSGVACTPGWKVGDEVGVDTRNGRQTYRCEQRPGDPCPVWHWVYDSDVPHGQKPGRACPQCPSSPPPVSASPSSSPPSSVPPYASPSNSPSTTGGVTPSPSVSASRAPELPVTGSAGPPPWGIALVGAAAVAVGGVLVWLAGLRSWVRRRALRVGTRPARRRPVAG